jgi:hypothetical protein
MARPRNAACRAARGTARGNRSRGRADGDQPGAGRIGQARAAAPDRGDILLDSDGQPVAHRRTIAAGIGRKLCRPGGHRCACFAPASSCRRDKHARAAAMSEVAGGLRRGARPDEPQWLLALLDVSGHEVATSTANAEV